jgi:Dolichyl-phosphate-mannose-protein mannosyltransferase
MTADRRREVIYVAAFAVLSLYLLIFPVWRAQFFIEIWPTESWNAYHQDAAATGLRLYPGADELIINNYPPLSFYVIGFLGKLFGDNLFVGRALSILALLSLTIEIFFAVRILVGSAIGGAIGALWYAAIMAHNSTIYVGANDPQLAGEAIMGAALVWFLARDRAGKRPELTLLLMVVAGFWKHNIIAVPLTAILWLLIQNWRASVRPILLSGAAACAGMLACRLLFGQEFLENLFTARDYAWGHVLGNIGHLQWVALAFFIWAAWAWSDRLTKAAKFTSLHIAMGLFVCILQWFGHSVGGNAEFDLIIAIGIGIGVTFARIDATWLATRIGVHYARDIMVALLILRLIASQRQESAWVLLSPDFRSSYYAEQAEVIKKAKLVEAAPGLVFCPESKMVCRMAGKPFTVDEFKVEEMIATGHSTVDSISALLKERRITVISDKGKTQTGEIGETKWGMRQSEAAIAGAPK